ncbi:MAG TPA: ribose-5-phosphate isomerase RpiA [Candidatus Binataceae bacterium]|nr:ribose-5-phosphate isomerase RpiA [Candidatus Binataceae bacterium]
MSATPPPSRDPYAALKQRAAEHAVGFVQSGMVVGLGTGSTAIFATRLIAARLRNGQLRELVAIATSRATHDEAQRLGIPLLADEMAREVDLTIDGADEVDPALHLIKGGGGALLREKLVAEASNREIIVVDYTKLSPRLGTSHRLPVEVLPFAWQSQARFLRSLGASLAVRRTASGAEYRTDQGNLILDCDFGPIDDPPALGALLDHRAGIMEHGLFIERASMVVVARPEGIEELTVPRP